MTQRTFLGETFGCIEDCASPSRDHLGDCISKAMLATLVRNSQGYNEDDLGLPEDTAPAGIRCGNHPRDLGMRHECPAAVRACYAVSADLAAQQAGEIYAEAGMSWVAGGGSPEDARIYASVIASGRSWDEYLTGKCGKHAPGTCNGYGTQCVPRHSPAEILAHRKS